MREDRALTVSKPEIFTASEAAKELHVKPKTIYAWIKAGKLGTLKLPGGDYRILREHLDAFKCPAKNSPDQTTACTAAKATSGTSPTPTRSVVTLGAFQQGRESVRGPRSGGTNG